MSSERVTWLASGVDLHNEGRGWSLQAASSVRVARSVRRSPLVVAGAHGSRRRGLPPVYDEASVTLRWLLKGGESQAGLVAAYDGLVGVLSRPGLVLGLRTDGQVVESPAELVTVTEPSEFVVGRIMRVEATLFLGDPFLRDPVVTESSNLTNGTNTLVALAGTAPVVDPVIRVAGPLSSVTVTDHAYGQGITWTGTVNTGQFLFVHPDRMVARRGAAGQSESGGTDVSAGLSYPGPGRLQLWPVTTEVPGPVVATNQAFDPGGAALVAWESHSTHALTLVGGWAGHASAVRATRTTTGAGRVSLRCDFDPDTTYTVRLRLRSSAEVTAQVRLRPNRGVATGQTALGDVTVPPGASVVTLTAVTTSTAPTPESGLALLPMSGAVGATLDVTGVQVEQGGAVGPFFSGDSAGAEWLGAPRASASVRREPSVLGRAATVTVARVGLSAGLLIRGRRAWL